MSLHRNSCFLFITPAYLYISFLVYPDGRTTERTVTDGCLADLITGGTAVGACDGNILCLEIILILLAVEIGLFLFGNSLRFFGFLLSLQNFLLCNGDLTFLDNAGGNNDTGNNYSRLSLHFLSGLP